AIPIPLQERQFGIKIGMLPDKKLLDTAVFVLGGEDGNPIEVLRRHFSGQAEIGPLQELARLLHDRLTGVPIRALPVAPRQIPLHMGTVYFELDRSTPLWADLKTSGAFAFHVSDISDFPGLGLEFWAIRS